MKILLMTDLEGVSGVRDFDNWCNVDSRFYAAACRLLTQEVNAAVDGFFAGGARSVLVVDGHGAGAIDIEQLDARADCARGWPPGPWPFGLDASFTGVAWVGQHAKASTPLAHLAHTQSCHYIDLAINGEAIGEFGQLALCAAELGVPCFFGAGDQAFTEEAEAFVPGIVTCAVKRGVVPGAGRECCLAEYQRRNIGAVHIAPPRARGMIRKAAEAAMWQLKKTPPMLKPLTAPFELTAVFRPDTPEEPRRLGRATHASSVIELLNTAMDIRPAPELT